MHERKMIGLRGILMVLTVSIAQMSVAQVSDTTKHATDSQLPKSNAVDTLSRLTASSDSLNEYVDEIISFAKRFIGTPYHYGGGTPSGFDCSGYINYIMGNFGIKLSRSAPGIADFGKTVKLADLQPGDLMFFKGRSTSTSSVGHVAMVVEVVNGQIKFIHSSTSRGVIIDTFNGSQYYVPRYIKAKRLDYGGITMPKK